MSPAAGPRADDGRARVPSDVERPDKILAGLTARQLAILAAAAVVLWAGYVATRHLLAPAAYGALALPVAAAAALLALGRMEGMPADRFLLAAVLHRASPRRLVPAPGGVPAAPGLLTGAGVTGTGGSPPAPLRLPLAGLGTDGVLDLGQDGMAVVCRASAVTFSLRTSGEQEALVFGFARFLNSLAEPVQVLVRAEPLDLRPAIEALKDAAPSLPHLALERAARDHARYLGTLAEGRDLLRREVLVVFRQPAGDDAASRLLRRAAEATSALAAAGVTLRALDADGAAALLGRCLDPAAPPGASSRPGGDLDEPVRLAAHPTADPPPEGAAP